MLLRCILFCGNGSVWWSWRLQQILSHMNESFTKYPTVVSGTIVKIMLDKDFYWFLEKELSIRGMLLICILFCGNGSIQWLLGLQGSLSHMNKSFTKYPTVVSGTIVNNLIKIFIGFWTRNYKSGECYWDASYFDLTAAWDGCSGFSEPCPICTKVLQNTLL